MMSGWTETETTDGSMSSCNNIDRLSGIVICKHRVTELPIVYRHFQNARARREGMARSRWMTEIVSSVNDKWFWNELLTCLLCC